MATTTRQTRLFGVEDWKRIYQTYKEADFQSFNFETLRKTFVDYIRQHHPENFNDYIESSEFIALLDVMAFMGQSLSFRNDLNTRENFLDTAERRDSVTRLAKLVGYTSKRNEASHGFLKVQSIRTTENVHDYNQNSLAGITVRWNDSTNADWQEQFSTILNSTLISSQKIGQPGHSSELVGINTDEYTTNMVPGFLPVVPFSASVNGTSMAFEVVSGTSQNKEYVYEPIPVIDAPLNVLYRNDGLGYNGPDTGYFFYFKQGSLKTQDFTITDRIANRTVDVGINNINNSDVWLTNTDNDKNTIWNSVDSIYAAENAQIEATERQFFSINSRVNDQITLLFGDGVFSQIPLGSFKAFVRSSNGLEYVINQTELQNIEITLNYVSKAGRVEAVTYTLGLTQSINNAKTKEQIADIKRRAPSRYYTQNRMVNGEDYTNFPYSSYNSIIKSKAINRSSIGTSRYLDLVDPTGKYSSINTYGDDGVLYRDETTLATTFTFNDINDIQSVISNMVEPLISSRNVIHFYYDKFTRVFTTANELTWKQSTSYTNETTGYFTNATGLPVALGSFASSDAQYIRPGSMMKFIPPLGYHFSEQNKLVPGTTINHGDKTEIWAMAKHITGAGTNNGKGNLDDGTGPVVINEFVPTGAYVSEIILPFITDLSTTLEQSLVPEIELGRNTGLGYDHVSGQWYKITHDNIDLDGAFSLANAKSTNNANDDASWIISFESTSVGYKLTSRVIKYYFGSILETRFFHDADQIIYDSRNGKSINDFIRVLKTNNQPDTHLPLNSDIVLDIIHQEVESDGFINDFNVEISFTDNDSDGVADDPDFFRSLVQPSTNVSNKFVFFIRTVDFDNLERYLPMKSSVIISEYPRRADIESIKNVNDIGQVFYAYAEDTFYEIIEDNNGIGLGIRNDLIAKVGRNDIHFQYKHNSPETRRINPGTSNIIDIYVVTNGYYESYINYMLDNTNTITEPLVPTLEELTTEYDKLQEYKMVSDNVILNSVKFKPLFGNKADLSLQAYLKVVKLENSLVSESEIKSKMVTSIQEYFNINVWDFGATFFFSELSAYIHKELGDMIGSVVLIPKDITKSFGDLYEIRSQANEIFVSSVTVSDIEIIDALTASKMQIGVA